MEVLIDTNIIMDYITKRSSQPNLEASVRTIESCAISDVHGLVAFHSISNLWYSLRAIPQEIRRQWLIHICELLTVVGTNHEHVVRALENNTFSDFEDCLQDECASYANADYIITWNTKDFLHSIIPAITPYTFLDIIKNEQQ